MNIYETIDLLKVELTEGNNVSTDLLYKVKIETNPYSDLSKKVPFVLIEADRTEFTNAEGYGHVVNQDHLLDLTCVVEAQNREFTKYKPDVNQLVKKTINKLMTIEHDDIQKIIPMELSHSELTIGALKTSAIIITVKVRTYWEDLLGINK